MIRSRAGNGEWVITMARPVQDDAGQVRAVLAVGTLLEHFQDALGLARLPPGSVVRIINENGIVIAQSENGPNWIGRDLSGSGQIARHLATRSSEVAHWSDGVERITGSSSAHLVPWLVSVGLPTDIAFATVRAAAWAGTLFVATLMTAFGIAWMLSGQIVRPFAATAQRCLGAGFRQAQPSQLRAQA